MSTSQHESQSSETAATEEQFLAVRDLYRARAKHGVLDMLLDSLDEFEAGDSAKRSHIARQMGVHRSVITRALSMPRNLTTETISDLLLAMGYAFLPRAVRIGQIPERNYIHPSSTATAGGPKVPNLGYAAPAPRPASTPSVGTFNFSFDQVSGKLGQ